jgi:hypothetical protein
MQRAIRKARRKGHKNDTELSREQRKKELTKDQKEKYERKLRENIETAFGEDRSWYYQLFGECYIHGMMGGEAMSRAEREYRR